MLKNFLRQLIRQVAAIGSCVLLALVLTACGPSPSDAPGAPSAAVHGEPIRGELIAPAAIAATAPAVAPVLPSPASQTIQPASPAPIAQVDVSSTADKPAAAPVVLIASAAIASPISTPPPASTAATARPAVSSIEGYAPVGFDKLASYNFEVDDAPFTNKAPDKANDQIPALVKGFNDQKIAIKGFMLPLKVADGVVTEFLIMKDQSTCCYGAVPKITEWVSVKTGPKGMKPIMDQPISILGTLHVGAMRENGYLVGIYQMDGDKLIAPEN